MQESLRQVFGKWGIPQAFRVDNGTPWGSKGDLPTDLALWLIGLDVEMIWIPARRPDKNGVVERMQGVGKNWAEPHTCDSPDELQMRLDDMDGIQREAYGSINGQSRMAAYPDLKHSGRKYTPAWERKHWRLQRVLDVLAGYAVRRTVDRSGCVSLYDRKYYVGEIHHGKTIYVLFDPQTREWVFTSLDGQQLRSRAAEEITRQRIITLTVSHRRDRTGRPRKPR